MKKLSHLSEIKLPKVQAPCAYPAILHGRNFIFRDLKHVLGAADISKAGDRNAKLAADDEVMREAARAILSDLTLQHFFDNPLTNHKNEIDSVMRVNYDIDHAVFAEISPFAI